MDYSTDNLIDRVQRIAAVPVNAPGFTDSVIRDILNDEMTSEIVPWLVSMRGEYLVETQDTAIDGTTEFFQIPAQAYGGLLREVKIVSKDSDALESDDEYIDLRQITPEDMMEGVNFPAFCLRSDRIQIMNVEEYKDDYLRLYYWRRPNDLCLSAVARVIATKAAGSVTVASVPSTWGSTPTIDIITPTPGFRAKGEAIAATVSGVTVTFTQPSDLAVGDWISLTGTSPVAQIPDSVYPYLAQMAALKVLETYPDAGGMQAVGNRAKMMRDRLEQIMTVRVEGAPKSFARTDNDIFG